MACRMASLKRESIRRIQEHTLLRQPQAREAELYQARKLYEMPSQRPNDQWQLRLPNGPNGVRPRSPSSLTRLSDKHARGHRQQ